MISHAEVQATHQDLSAEEALKMKELHQEHMSKIGLITVADEETSHDTGNINPLPNEVRTMQQDDNITEAFMQELQALNRALRGKRKYRIQR